MASLGGYLPSAGSAVWRRDRSSSERGTYREGNRVRHVVIRDAEIREKPSPHVVYRIDVLTEHDHWYLYRRYSQFHTLHRKLMKRYAVSRELLPPKKLAGNLSKQLIDKRRQLLERYLQKLIHSESQISQSQELLLFLDVPAHDVIKVADILTHHLYRHGDRLLEEEVPIALSVNEMYSITQRLQLPRDPQGVDASDVAADPAHLYSFVHQLASLRVSPPPPPTSVCCSPFELAPFRSLHSLKLDRVPLVQVHGLVSVQQQLKKLSVHRSLRSLRDILIDAVEEKRVAGRSPPGSPGKPPDPWRLTAMAKLTDNRVVIQPWHQLHTLTLSHNHLTHLDDCLQVLPALRELNLSHNLLQSLQLQFLCLPSLERLTVAHNHIQFIQDASKVLENVTFLDLSHNRLSTLEGLHAFVSLSSLNLSYNLVASCSDLDKLTQLRTLSTLSLTGNPITATHTCRLVVLAKFMRKSRMVSLDGQEASSKEQAKIQSLVERYGNDPDSWPITKSLYTSSSEGAGTTAATNEPFQGRDEQLELSWQVHNHNGSLVSPVQADASFRRSLGLQGYRVSPRVDRSFDHDKSPLSEDSLEHPLLTHELMGSQAGSDAEEGGFVTMENEERYSVGSWHSTQEGGLPSREEPDGQSDISSVSPEVLLVPPGSDPPSSHSLSPPPSTPLTANGNNKPTITPVMIQSALDALYHIQNKDTPLSLTPRDDTPTPIFPEAVTSALTAWIQSGHSTGTTPLISPPPSTPLEANHQERVQQAISAMDLIGALSALIPPQDGGGEDSGESSNVCSVPACTPQDGISGWLKLGIQPDEVIQALTALTIRNSEDGGQQEEEEGGRGPLTPIQEEQCAWSLERKLEKLPNEKVEGEMDTWNTTLSESENDIPPILDSDYFEAFQSGEGLEASGCEDSHLSQSPGDSVLYSNFPFAPSTIGTTSATCPELTESAALALSVSKQDVAETQNN